MISGTYVLFFLLMANEQYYQERIAVFGRKRMILPDTASPTANEQLLLTIQTLAIEHTTFDNEGRCASTYARAVGRPLVAQVNTDATPGCGIPEKSWAMATIYGLKNRDVRVILPKFGFLPGVYEEDETIYIDHAKRARIHKHFTPLGGNWLRDLTSSFAVPLGATKYATEAEVQEAMDIISKVVMQDDERNSN
jgi:hypothetical protein